MQQPRSPVHQGRTALHRGCTRSCCRGHVSPTPGA